MRLLEAGRNEHSSGVLLDEALPAQVAKERPETGQLSSRGDLAQALAMQPSEESPDGQVVDVGGRTRSPELLLEVGGELAKVLLVGFDRVRRGVTLALEVEEEGCNGLPHALFDLLAVHPGPCGQFEGSS